MESVPSKYNCLVSLSLLHEEDQCVMFVFSLSQKESLDLLFKKHSYKTIYFKDKYFVLKRINPVLEKKTITWSYIFLIGKVQVHFLNIRLFRQLCHHNYRNSSV